MLSKARFRTFLITVLSIELFGAAYLFEAPIANWFTRTFPTGSLSRFADLDFWAPIYASLRLALIAGFLATALAFTASWWLWRYRMHSSIRRSIELCLKLPYLLPGFFFAMGWIALAAPEVGYFRKFITLPSPYGFWGIVLVETLWTTSLAMIQLQSFFQNMPSLLEDAALLCGANPFQVFLKITTPIAKRQIAGCVLLCMTSSLAAFGIPAMMGLPAHSYVATTKIYQEIKSSSSFGEVSLLSAVMMAITTIMVIAYYFATRSRMGSNATLISGKSASQNRLRLNAPAMMMGTGIVLLCFFATVAPLGAVLFQSLLADRGDLSSWSIEKYTYVFAGVPDGRIAATNSLILATLTATLLTLFGLVTAYARVKTTGITKRLAGIANNFWNFTYAMPGTLLALPLLIYFQNSIANTLWIIGVAFAVKYAAFAVRTLEPALSNIDPSLEEAAWLCGASPGRTFSRIIIPLSLPAISAALALSLIPMLSELTMSVFLIGAGTETLGTLIYRFQEYADPGSASVLAVTVAVVTLSVNFALKRMSRGRFGI